jgi:hypothetical protein
MSQEEIESAEELAAPFVEVAPKRRRPSHKSKKATKILKPI